MDHTAPARLYYTVCVQITNDTRDAPADSAPRAVESEQAAANKAVNKTTKK
jgi:hypothetical protein